MSNNTNFNNEIDLSVVYRNTVNTVYKIIYTIIDILLKKKFIILGLTIIGLIIGFFSLNYFSRKESNILILANNNSVDYLYSKVDFLESNLKKNNKIFTNIKHIEIEPIADVYNFIGSRESNLEVFKLYAEDGDISKITKDPEFFKNFNRHIITINNAKENISDKDVHSLIDYLNKEPFFKKLVNTTLDNYKNSIQKNELMISQIDAILNNLNSTDKSTQLVYINESKQLNDLIQTKQNLIEENNKIRLRLIENENVITLVSSDLNIIKQPKLYSIFIYPILLNLFYFIIIFNLNLYRKLKTKIK